VTDARSLPRGSLSRPRPVRPAAHGKLPRRRRPWWPWVRRVLLAAFLAVVAALLVRYARRIDWPEVWHNLVSLPHRVVFGAIVLAAISHLLYATFDLVSRHYVRHQLATRTVLQVGAISYAFNLSMGSLVGGVGFRLRLYSRLGLTYGEIARVLTLGMITNWIGYLLLSGIVYAFAPLELPPQWHIGGDELSLLGVALIAVALAYLALCGFSKRRSWMIRGHELFLPSWRVALVQLSLSCSHWMFIAAVIWALMMGQVPYATVLSVFLVAAMAGVIVHVPAGLGVMEAVFLALLSPGVPAGQLLGAMLGFRAVFYILPLAIGALLYLRMELKARHHERLHRIHATGRKKHRQGSAF
jgi:uncharacterized membrane protein YbhN (UPF0104 family)